MGHFDRGVVGTIRVGDQNPRVDQRVRQAGTGRVLTDCLECRTAARRHALIVDVDQCRKERVQCAIIRLPKGPKRPFGLGLNGTVDTTQRVVVLQFEPSRLAAPLEHLLEREGHQG